MSQAVVPFVATVVLAFVVYRWASYELPRDRQLSTGAVNALLALFILVTLLMVVAALGGFGRFYDSGVVAVSAGASVAAAGSALPAAAVWALGSREQLLWVQFDAVVSRGPYRYTRHPFYLGWTAALLGIAAAGATGPGLTIAVIAGVLLVGLARSEERFLLEELGADYERYRRRTRARFGRCPDPPGWPSPTDHPHLPCSYGP